MRALVLLLLLACSAVGVHAFLSLPATTTTAGARCSSSSRSSSNRRAATAGEEEEAAATRLRLGVYIEHTDRYGMVYNSNYLLFLNRCVRACCMLAACSDPIPPPPCCPPPLQQPHRTPHHNHTPQHTTSAIHRALGGQRHAVLRLDNFRFKASARLGHDINVEVAPRPLPASEEERGCVL